MNSTNPELKAKFEQQARRGNPYAQVFMFVAAEYGFLGFTKQEINPFNELLELGGHQGFADAQTYLGNNYRDGKNGYRKDYIKAIEFYELASQQNHAAAYHCLGYLYSRNDQGVSRDVDRAIEYFTSAVRFGFGYSKADLDELLARKNSSPQQAARTQLAQPQQNQYRAPEYQQNQSRNDQQRSGKTEKGFDPEAQMKAYLKADKLGKEWGTKIGENWQEIQDAAQNIGQGFQGFGQDLNQGFQDFGQNF